MAPKVASVLAGYKVQELKHEQSELREQRRNLDVEEAELLSPARLDVLAQKQKLDRPRLRARWSICSPAAMAAFASVIGARESENPLGACPVDAAVARSHARSGG